MRSVLQKKGQVERITTGGVIHCDDLWSSGKRLVSFYIVCTVEHGEIGFQHEPGKLFSGKHRELLYAIKKWEFRLRMTIQVMPMATQMPIKIIQPCMGIFPPNAPAALVNTQASPRPSRLAIEKRMREIFPIPAT